MSYIRIVKTKNGIRFFTSDYKKHINMNSAINYVTDNYDKLKDCCINFDVMYYRMNKMNKIMNKIKRL